MLAEESEELVSSARLLGQVLNGEGAWYTACARDCIWRACSLFGARRRDRVNVQMPGSAVYGVEMVVVVPEGTLKQAREPYHAPASELGDWTGTVEVEYL